MTQGSSLIERLRESQVVAVTEQEPVTLIMEDGSRVECGSSSISTCMTYNRDGEAAASLIEELAGALEDALDVFTLNGHDYDESKPGTCDMCDCASNLRTIIAKVRS